LNSYSATQNDLRKTVGTQKGASMQKFKSRKSIRRAFTLIELLVVIAIIAILAAILFPVFAKAREKARQASCLSNEKQISLALLQYTQDNDEALPYMYYSQVYADGGPSNNTAAYRYKWMDAIFPYIKSEAVFNCPDAAYPMTDSFGNTPILAYRYYQNQASSTTAYYYGSYAMNCAYRNDASTSGWTSTAGHFPNGVNLAQLAVPASTMWVTDGSNYYSGWSTKAAQPTTAAALLTTSNGVVQMNNIVARHTGFTNTIFCDGHAKAIQLSSIATLNGNGVVPALTVDDD